MKICIENISKSFARKNKNTFLSVQPTTINIPEHSMISLMGRSGSGKSTFLNIISGLLKPSSGTVKYDDIDIYALSDTERAKFRSEHIGIIPQGQTMVQSLNIIENICLPYLLEKNDKKYTSAMSRASQIMTDLHILDLKYEMPASLSGGELRRAAIARSMIKNPDIIFADEPTCDLDNENTQLVLQILKNISESNTTVFIVTHEQEILNYANIQYTMDSGIIQ